MLVVSLRPALFWDDWVEFGSQSFEVDESWERVDFFLFDASSLEVTTIPDDSACSGTARTRWLVDTPEQPAASRDL